MTKMFFVSPPGKRLTTKCVEGNIRLAQNRKYISPRCKNIEKISGNNLNNPILLAKEIKIGNILCVPEKEYTNLIKVSVRNIREIRNLLSLNAEKSSYEILVEFAKQNSK